MDRRVKKTELAFQKALFHFLKTKELKKITVKELCEYADMNRGTFYLHYIDIYDLMDKTEQRMVDIIYDAHADVSSMPDGILTAFDYIKKHKEEYRLLIKNGVNSGFINKLTYKILNYPLVNMAKHLPDADEQTIHNIQLFYVGGGVSLLYGWLANDCATPASELLRCISLTADYIYQEKQALLQNA